MEIKWRMAKVKKETTTKPKKEQNKIMEVGTERGNKISTHQDKALISLI